MAVLSLLIRNMIKEELLHGIRRSDQHGGGIHCLTLFRIEPVFATALRGDVERLCLSQLGSDVTNPDHISHWTKPFGEVVQFSLFNASGGYEDFSNDHNLSCFGKQFYGAQAYPTLARFISALPHLVNFRVNLMGSGAGLSPHEEHTIIRTLSGSVGAKLRFHLPIVTNPCAELMLENRIYRLDEGKIYFVNHGCVHSARNGGDQPRIHLVWDMLLTAQTFELMFGNEILTLPELIRMPIQERELVPLGKRRIGAYQRLMPEISREESINLDFCDPQ